MVFIPVYGRSSFVTMLPGHTTPGHHRCSLAKASDNATMRGFQIFHTVCGKCLETVYKTEQIDIGLTW